jgi:hypothetical protein
MIVWTVFVTLSQKQTELESQTAFPLIAPR